MSANDPDEKPVNKATMDAPQEEFIADQSVPSAPKQIERDSDHGAKVDGPQQDEASTEAEEDRPKP